WVTHLPGPRTRSGGGRVADLGGRHRMARRAAASRGSRATPCLAGECRDGHGAVTVESARAQRPWRC
ncbi:MAG: hypothetical protein AVDCRST_MAG49-3700, partial [uncultured Thermomicrobiales bacterium]